MRQTNKRRILKQSGAMLSLLAGLWLSVSITSWHVLGRSAPILWMSPTTLDVQLEREVARLAQSPSNDDISTAEAAAIAVFRRDFANVVAVRTLGVAAEVKGDRDRAARLFAIAESLSRRDLPTQMALIELKVARNDIPAALTHYNRALSTSSAARKLLLPILVQAAAIADVRAPLIDMAQGRPIWWSAFVDETVQSSRSPEVIEAAARFEAFADDPHDRERLGRVLTKLTELNAPAPALRLYRASRGPKAHGSTGLIGSFESEAFIPPFEWWLLQADGGGAIVEERDGAEGRLALSLPGSGELARRLLVLPQGRYALSVLTGDLGEDPLAMPRLLIKCQGGQNLTVMQVRAPGRSATSFTVPPSCANQWIHVERSGTASAALQGPWIDQVVISPSGPKG